MPITFVPLLFLLCQVLRADFGDHTHIVDRVNLEVCVQKRTVTQASASSGTESPRELKQNPANPAN